MMGLRLGIAAKAAVLVLGMAVRPACAAAPLTVTTMGGTLLGKPVSDTVVAFKGIPYAAPPIGDLRWKPPAPTAPWSGTRDASRFGASCVQPLSPPSGPKNIYADDPPKMAEDCLYLNVWTPVGARPDAVKKAPVMVWIHGGALTTGNLASPFYDGAILAKHGVVVVTVGYRLGVLGFLAHPELSAESPDQVSGNYGLLDQIQALRWVKANIASFGGDPDNVTLFGESAGGLSVMDQMTSPLARGLFTRAIAESAYMISTPELKTARFGQVAAEAAGAAVAGKLHAPDLAALRAMDPRALTDQAGAAGFAPFGTVDGKVLPHQIVESVDRGEQAHVPLLVGFNAGEIRSLRALMAPVPPSPAAYEAEVHRRYGDLADAYLKLYPSATPEESDLAATRDGLYGWTAVRMATKQAAIGQPSFLYYFDHTYPAELAQGLRGFHASEVPYVFGQVGPGTHLPEAWVKPPQTPAEAAFSEAVMSYWTAFARDGAPDPQGQPVWKSFADHGGYMDFADTPKPATDLLPGMYALHEEVIARRRQAGKVNWFLNVGLAAPVMADPKP